MATILIAEDNAMNRELLRELLELRGHTVIEVLDGPQAIDTVKTTVPDLFLLDVQMPGMDGFELLRALRDDPRCRNVPAAAVTAFAMGGDREKVLARGFDAYLEKPIDLPALTAVLNELLAGGNKRTQGE